MQDKLYTWRVSFWSKEVIQHLAFEVTNLKDLVFLIECNLTPYELNGIIEMKLIN